QLDLYQRAGLAASFGTGELPLARRCAYGKCRGLLIAICVLASFAAAPPKGYGQCDSSFTAATNYAGVAHPASVAIGDFNGDGKPDLAIVNDVSGTVTVRLGSGTGTLGPPVSYGVGTNPTSIAIADLNGDGKADLAVTNFGSNSVSVLMGNGN